MILDYLQQLSSDQRNQRADRHLGYWLAAVAGAVNAGGFLAIGQYTSHMTGIVSGMADHLALGDLIPVLAGLSAWLAFVTGAATTAVLVNLARRRNLRSQYALTLLLEAALLLLFGLAGAYLSALREFLTPVTVLLLCYIMGLQNAVITKVSSATIRTTHLTGLSTDLGIELGKRFYINRSNIKRPGVFADRDKIKLHSRLIGCFLSGGIVGAVGFKYLGYGSAGFLALAVALLAVGPVWLDVRRHYHSLGVRRARRRGGTLP